MQETELSTAPAHSLLTTRSCLLFSAYFGAPLGLLVGSYVWLAVDHGTPWLWNVVVHEGGDHTLRNTIFYFSHFLREIPVDVAYALFLATYFAKFVGVSGGVGSGSRKRAAATATGAMGAAVALAVLALVAASAQQGFGSAFRDLLQYRTRDDLYAYGSHWHFHWLSTIWFGTTAMLLVPFSAAIFGRGTDGALPRRKALTWLPWIYFFALTLAFGVSIDTFVDIRYAGHQAREIITHGPITALLGLGSLHVVSMRLRRHRRLSEKSALPILRRNRGTWFALALFFAIPLFLALVSWTGDVIDAGQSEHGLAAMVGGHVFEHVLDYAFVAILAVGIYGLLLLDSTKHGDMR